MTKPIIYKFDTISQVKKELADFPIFLQKLEKLGANEIGVAKIIFPEDWQPVQDFVISETFLEQCKYPIMKPFEQKYETISPGVYLADFKNMAKCNVDKFLKKAKDYPSKPESMTPDQLEKEFWRLQALETTPTPIYANEIEFNLMDNPGFNFKTMKTILNELEVEMKGINTSFLYFGIWRSYFVWHVEDRDLGGANFLHYGEAKTWNVVPPAYGHSFKKLVNEKYSSKKESQFPTCEDFMRHKRVLMSPEILKRNGIPVVNVVQNKNEMVLVWPFSFHSGFNHGLNFAEAINWGSIPWIEFGKRATRCCKKLDKKIPFKMDYFVKKYQAPLYPLWKSGYDVAPHPCDSPKKKLKFMVEMAELRKQCAELKKERKALQLKFTQNDDPKPSTSTAEFQEDTSIETAMETSESLPEKNSELIKKLAIQVKKKQGNVKKPFECPLCTYKAAKKNWVENHYLVIHTTEKPFKCEKCSLAFKRKELLARHVRIIHEKRKRYSCDAPNCEYKSDQKTDITKHKDNKH